MRADETNTCLSDIAINQYEQAYNTQTPHKILLRGRTAGSSILHNKKTKK